MCSSDLIADISYVIENPTQGFHMPCEGGMDEDLVFEATCGTTGTDGVSPLTDSGSVFVESCKGGTALGDVGCGVDSAVLPVVGIKKFFDIDWGPYLPNVPAACPPGCDHPCEQWGGFFEAVTNPGVQCTWSLQCWDMASPRGGCVSHGIPNNNNNASGVWLDSDAGKWRMRIYIDFYGLLWEGEKEGGFGPLGTYTRTAGLAPTWKLTLIAGYYLDCQTAATCHQTYGEVTCGTYNYSKLGAIFKTLPQTVAQNYKCNNIAWWYNNTHSCGGIREHRVFFNRATFEHLREKSVMLSRYDNPLYFPGAPGSAGCAYYGKIGSAFFNVYDCVAYWMSDADVLAHTPIIATIEKDLYLYVLIDNSYGKYGRRMW